MVLVGAFVLGGIALSRSSDTKTAQLAAKVTSAPTASDPTIQPQATSTPSSTTTTTDDAASSFLTLRADYPHSAHSSIATDTVGQGWAMIASGTTAIIFVDSNGSWLKQGTVTIPLAADNYTSIATGNWTRSSGPDFMISLSGADSDFGSVVYFDATVGTWRLATFVEKYGDSQQIEGLEISAEAQPLDSVENDCAPSCATGHDITYDWAFNSQKNKFVMTGSSPTNRD